MQCLRKYYNSGMKVHLVNAGKYFSRMIPPLVFVLVPGSRFTHHSLFWLYCSTMTFGTIYCLVWDYYMDWGLLRSKEKGKYGLRPNIQFPAKFYYFAIVTNFILRFYWVVGIYDYPYVTPVGKYMKKVEMMVFMKTMAEALRRTQWILIRVENEYHNNFEAYRTIPVIPQLMDDVDNTINNLKKY